MSINQPPLPDQQKTILTSRINQATGNLRPKLAEILCEFPDYAEKFIRTQDYAFSVEGKRGIWYNIRHKVSGVTEPLGINDEQYTARNVLEVMDEIDDLKGVTDNENYSPDINRIQGLLKIVDTPPKKQSDSDKITMRTLQVLGVGESDIKLLKEIVKSQKEADKYNTEARRLHDEAKKKEAESALTIGNMRKTLYAQYPRKNTRLES